MASTESIPAGFTRSDLASSSASTLESFLDSLSAAPSSLNQAVKVVSSTLKDARQTVTGKSAATSSSSLPSPSSESVTDEDEDVSRSASSHHAHHGTHMAFLITYFVAGGAAGATSRTVVSPLERLKIIMQVQPQQSASNAAKKGKKAYSGVWTGLSKMWREEGFAGFMRGNGINCLRIAPYSAVQFSTYELIKTWLQENSVDGELDVVRKLSAGALAGIASVVSTYPLDLVRSRISIASASMYSEATEAAAEQTGISPTAAKAKPSAISAEALRAQIAKKQKAVPGIWAMTKKVYAEEGGLRGLYRGCIPTSVGVAPYVALNFYFYEAARARMMPEDGSEPSALMKLACGAVAGSISQTFTYPLDVLRRRMQVAGMKDSKLGYHDKNAIDCIKNIVRAEGVTGLYRGLLPNLLKVAPSIGTSFLTYEAVKSFLEDHMDELHLTSHDDTEKKH